MAIFFLQISKYCHFCTNISLKTGKNLLYELTVTSLFNVGILKCDIFFFFFFIIKCQECNKNRQNVFSTTNYFAMVQRINQCDFLFFTNGYLSLKFENFAVLKGYYCLSQS